MDRSCLSEFANENGHIGKIQELEADVRTMHDAGQSQTSDDAFPAQLQATCICMAKDLPIGNACSESKRGLGEESTSPNGPARTRLSGTLTRERIFTVLMGVRAGRMAKDAIPNEAASERWATQRDFANACILD